MTHPLSYRQFLEDKATQDLKTAVSEGMWPFSPGQIELWIKEDFRLLGRQLFVHTRHGDCTVHFDQSLLMSSLDGLVSAAASQIFFHFRTQPRRMEPEPNIVLGEE